MWICEYVNMSLGEAEKKAILVTWKHDKLTLIICDDSMEK